MPKKLPDEMELVTWRVRASDLDYLRAIHPNVNEYVRELLHAVVERQRARGLERVPVRDTTPSV